MKSGDHHSTLIPRRPDETPGVEGSGGCFHWSAKFAVNKKAFAKSHPNDSHPSLGFAFGLAGRYTLFSYYYYMPSASS